MNRSKIAVLLTALCNAVPEEMTVDSSDCGGDEGEFYVDSPASNEKFLVTIRQTD